jgi:hypothetical protein
MHPSCGGRGEIKNTGWEGCKRISSSTTCSSLREAHSKWKTDGNECDPRYGNAGKKQGAEVTAPEEVLRALRKRGILVLIYILLQ